MKLAKRQARAKARKKTMALRRQPKPVPCTASKHGWAGAWEPPLKGLTPGDVESARKRARREGIVTTSTETFNDS